MKFAPATIRFFLPVVLWAAVIFAFSSYPTGSASQVYWEDFIAKKLAHVFEYAVLSLLIYRALVNTGRSKGSSAILAFLISVLYGMTDEVHQSFTPGREPRARDLVFDTIGASIPVYFVWKLLPKAPRKLQMLAANFQIR